MKAMLLAAGVGRRLYPLTIDRPKPTIPVLGRPMAIQILQRLAAAGIEQAVVNLHHHPERLRALLGEGESALPDIAFSLEETILGTGGGLRHAAPRLRGGDGTIVVHNCDFLSDIDIAAAARAHRESGLPATLVLAPQRPGYSVIEVDRRGRILSLAGEPHAEPVRVAGRHLFTGCHFIQAELLDRIPPGPSDIVRDLYRDLAREGRLGSYLHEGFWWEFGSPELYLEGSLKLLDLSASERVAVANHDPVQSIDGATVAVGAGVRIDAEASLSGRVALGLASRVGRDCKIRDSIVMPETWIGPGCRLHRTVVAQGMELPAGFEAEQALICRDPDPRAPLLESTRRVNGLLVYSFDLHAV